MVESGWCIREPAHIYCPVMIAIAASLVLLSLTVKCQQLIDNGDPFPNTRPVLKFASQGGPNGTLFDDLENITNVLKIQSIAIGSLYQVDYIQITYVLSNGTLYKAPEHGDGIFTPDIITLAADEYLEKLEGLTNGEYVNQLIITTYATKDQGRRVYGPYGTPKLNATQKFVFDGNIVGFHGAVGKVVLSNIGVYSLAPVNKSALFGNVSFANATHFVDDPDGIFPPAVKISKIYIRHGYLINAIQVEYQLFRGGTRKGPLNGGNGGSLTVLNFAPDERIICVKGKIRSLSHTLGQLTFLTMNKKNDTIVYGPFGVLGNKEFSLNSNVIGFAGTVHRNVIQAIQVFYYIT